MKPIPRDRPTIKKQRESIELKNNWRELDTLQKRDDSYFLLSFSKAQGQECEQLENIKAIKMQYQT